MLKRGVTPIEDLIDLDNEERNETVGKIKNRAIRNLGMNGGMSEYEKVYNQPPRIEPQYVQEPHYVQEPQYVRQYTADPVSCLAVSEHAHNCPVCCRLYNTDKSLYMIIIAILVIICIILLKRVLEK
jgi:hypothetical protein